MHPDPEFDATGSGWHSIVGFRPCGLRLDGTLDRINGAAEFRQHAVTSRICDRPRIDAIRPSRTWRRSVRSRSVATSSLSISGYSLQRRLRKLPQALRSTSAILGHNPPETADIIERSAGGTPQIQVAHPFWKKGWMSVLGSKAKPKRAELRWRTRAIRLDPSLLRRGRFLRSR